MRPFVLNCVCPTCDFDAPHHVAACKATATEVPLRCADAADPAELAAWPSEIFEKDGKKYRPVTKVIDVPDVRQEWQKQEGVDADNNPLPDKLVDVNFTRKERVVDEAATLAAGPATPPRTIPHVHRTCPRCGDTWAESKE